MRTIVLLLLVLTVACNDQRPAAPTSAESDDLNTTANQLDALANEPA